MTDEQLNEILNFWMDSFKDEILETKSNPNN
jgi:hypothetical protein